MEGALRRFNFAAERTLPEDAIVDLMIAAETLFLSEAAPVDRGELRYRGSDGVSTHRRHRTEIRV